MVALYWPTLQSCVCMYVSFFPNTWHPLISVITTLLRCNECFSSSSAVSCIFSVLCVYSKFRHHPHPTGYLCAKFHFFHGIHCWANPRTEIVYSMTAYMMPGNRSLCFGTIIYYNTPIYIQLLTNFATTNCTALHAIFFIPLSFWMQHYFTQHFRSVVHHICKAILLYYNFELNAHPNYLFISPFNASCSKLLQFGGFSAILV